MPEKRGNSQYPQGTMSAELLAHKSSTKSSDTFKLHAHTSPQAINQLVKGF